MKRTSHRFCSRLVLALSLLLALVAGGALADDAPLTNADVLKMSKADLGNDLIIAKIKQAAMVEFKLDTDDIIDLKGEGVSQEVISAMLDRTTVAPSGGGGGDDYPPVTLVTSSGSTALSALEGDHNQFAAPFVGLRHFLDFDGRSAEVRTNDRQPTLELRLNRDPGDHWWIVELEPDDDDPTLGLDLESAGTWGGAHTFEPDDDQIIKSNVVDAGSGLWKFTPRKSLKPGEYGLYCEEGFVYEFGVDR